MCSLLSKNNNKIKKLKRKWRSITYVTGSGKTSLIHTSTEIQFLSISERYTHALPRNTKYLAIDGQVCFYRCCKTTEVHVMVLGRVNRTAWGTKLLLTAIWASLVDCTSSRHLLKAHHCSLSSNGCFTSPSAPTRPHHPPHPPPTHPPPIESIRDITGAEINHQKTSSIQVACKK